MKNHTRKAMAEISLLRTLPVANRLGEGVLWDDLGQAFYWTDILDRKLYRYQLADDRLQQWDTPERLCSFGLIEDDEDALIAAFESGIAIYHPEAGRLEWLARPEAAVAGTRFNDGRVDRQGRFWSGTMVEGDEAVDAQGRPVSASLYRVDRGVCTRVEGGLRITNSLAWSLDSTRQYLADTPARVIYAYDFDRMTGTPSKRRLFARSEPPAEPDGSCIDADDHLWNARWRGGNVLRYRPDGSIDRELVVPVSQPTCVSFGGPALDLLAVTSASVDLNEGERAEQPLAGALFIFQTGYRGVPEPRYLK